MSELLVIAIETFLLTFCSNNIPVFFIQDAMKFPDVIHAGKPEPDNEMPQAQSAHNNFWGEFSIL